LKPFLPDHKGDWTEAAHLPGGDIPRADFDTYYESAKARYAWLPAPVLHRMLRTYGTRIERVLGEAKTLGDLGRDYGAGLYQADIDYLVAYEYARTPEDILYRRTKRGLHMDAAQIEAVQIEENAG